MAAPKIERKPVQPPDVATIAAILREAEGTDLHVPVLIAATTGLRRSEILGLTWSAVDLDQGIARVVQTVQTGSQTFAPVKSDRARRTVYLPPVAVSVLRQHRKDQSARRLRLGKGWHDHDLVVDRGDGRPASPDGISHEFRNW